VITPVAVAAAELHALGRTGESETVVHVLGGGTEVGLIVNVPTAQVPTACLAEGQVEFKLADAQAQNVGRQFEEAPDIDELQVSVAQAAAGAGAANADVVIDPESDVTAKISGHKYAKQSRLKVGPWDKRSKLSRGQLQVEVIAILAHDLEESVEAQSDRRQAWNGPRPDGMRPKLFLRGRSQHDGRYLNEAFVVFGKLEARVFERLPKIVQLGKVHMACGARSSVLPGKRRNRAGRWNCTQENDNGVTHCNMRLNQGGNNLLRSFSSFIRPYGLSRGQPAGAGAR
jgi:hypothetical protein